MLYLLANWSWAGKYDQLLLSARSPKQHVITSKWQRRANRCGRIFVNKWPFSLLTKERFSQIQCCFAQKSVLNTMTPLVGHCNIYSAGDRSRGSLGQLFTKKMWEK